MTVLRIVTNVATVEPERVSAFYKDIFGLRVAMDHGWIVTLAADGKMQPQISFASEGGSGTLVPDVSIEVDDFAAVKNRVDVARLEIVYGPVDEPWGVRRMYVRDPAGRLLNILQHL